MPVQTNRLAQSRHYRGKSIAPAAIIRARTRLRGVERGTRSVRAAMRSVQRSTAPSSAQHCEAREVRLHYRIVTGAAGIPTPRGLDECGSDIERLVFAGR